MTPASMVECVTLILDAIGGPASQLTLGEAACRAWPHCSTVHRILDQLVRLNRVEHAYFGYFLDRRALRLGGNDDEICAAAVPLLHDCTCRATWWCTSPSSTDLRESTSARSRDHSRRPRRRGSVDEPRLRDHGRQITTGVARSRTCRQPVRGAVESWLRSDCHRHRDELVPDVACLSVAACGCRFGRRHLAVWHPPDGATRARGTAHLRCGKVAGTRDSNLPTFEDGTSQMRLHSTASAGYRDRSTGRGRRVPRIHALDSL